MGQSLTAQARAKLKEIGGEIDKANTTLSQKQGTITELTSDEEARRSRIVNLAEEEREIVKSIEAKKAEASGLDTAYGESKQKMQDADTERHTARREKENHETRQTELIAENASLETDKAAREREIEGLDRVKLGLEGDVRRLNAEKVTLDHDLSAGRAALAKVQTLYERVKGAVETALEQFRVFEHRIGRLSQETGYMISWEDPKKLLEEE